MICYSLVLYHYMYFASLPFYYCYLFIFIYVKSIYAIYLSWHNVFGFCFISISAGLKFNFRRSKFCSEELRNYFLISTRLNFSQQIRCESCYEYFFIFNELDFWCSVAKDLSTADVRQLLLVKKKLIVLRLLQLNRRKRNVSGSGKN